MAAEKVNSSKTYIIPENFIESGRVFNGMFKLRNFIEALFLGSIALIITLSIPIQDSANKLTFVSSVVLPIMFICILGINDDSVLTFVRLALTWQKNHHYMLYDKRIHAKEESPLEMMMSESLPRDVVIGKIEHFTKQRKDSKHEKMRNVEFVFEDDREYTMLKTAEEREEKKQKGGKKSKFKQDNEKPDEEAVHIDIQTAKSKEDLFEPDDLY